MMSQPKYTRMEDNAPCAWNPPSYSQLPEQPAHTKMYGKIPSMPPQYQPAISTGPTFQPSQTIIISHDLPANEPDYLAYSIFTMLCCCLPLGIAALVYSVKTQEANRFGNRIAAQQSSRVARNLAHAALGIGLGFLILYIVLSVIAAMHA